MTTSSDYSRRRVLDLGDDSAIADPMRSRAASSSASLWPALAVQPKLLLDEPFSSLDIATKSHLYRAIRPFCDEFGLTLVVVSHDPVEAAALCSRAAVLEEGRIMEAGNWQSLLRAPASETLRAFVAQLPRATGEPSVVRAGDPPAK